MAAVAVGIMLMGGFLGLLIQRTGLVPKRLHWGIVAATMFTNFVSPLFLPLPLSPSIMRLDLVAVFVRSVTYN